jgi:CPA2 family monovalent cation:H+ antiporter-2
VLVLVLLPALAPAPGDHAAGAAQASLWVTAGLAVLKLGVFGAAVALVGAHFVPWLLLRVARLRSRELFTLTVLVIAMAVATLGYLSFGASMALGAFLAGMVVAQSKVSHQAAADALPMRDAFAVLFFVSVGMLFDYREIFAEPWLVAGLLLVVLIVKPVTAMAIVLASGHSLRTGLTVAGGLAQIGEFSFILAEAANRAGLMPAAGHHALVACAIISISLNPWLFKRLLELEPWLKKHPRLLGLANRRVAALGEQANRSQAGRHGQAAGAVIVGYGPVGRTVARRAEEYGLVPVVVDFNIDTVLALQAEGKRALFGDGTHADILKEAGIAQAGYLIVSLPDTRASVMVVSLARQLNPGLRILARARYLADGGALEQAGVDAVCYDEAEAATALSVVLKAHLQAAAPAGENI